MVLAGSGAAAAGGAGWVSWEQEVLIGLVLWTLAEVVSPAAALAWGRLPGAAELSLYAFTLCLAAAAVSRRAVYASLQHRH